MMVDLQTAAPQAAPQGRRPSWTLLAVAVAVAVLGTAAAAAVRGSAPPTAPPSYRIALDLVGEGKIEFAAVLERGRRRPSNAAQGEARYTEPLQAIIVVRSPADRHAACRIRVDDVAVDIQIAPLGGTAACTWTPTGDLTPTNAT